MIIYDETKSIILTKEQCDLTKGYLYPEKKVVGYRPSLVEKTINTDGSITTKTYNKLEIEEDILVYKPYTQKQLYVNEKQDLEYWFDTTYREMFEKCTRRISLGILMRDGSDPEITLSQLYAEAEAKANRINQLENLINAL